MAAFQFLKFVAWNCFLVLSKDGERTEGKQTALLPAETVEAVAQFVHHKSSLSLIHYYNQQQQQKEKNETGKGKGKEKEKEKEDEIDNDNKNEEEDKQEKEKAVEDLEHDKETEEKERCVCELHRDTGLLTIGVCSDVQGLQIFDRKLNAWVRIESIATPCDIVLFIGEKVPLFGRSDRYPATPHRVMVRPSGEERYSLVFLLDIAK
jgi:isopenicillin N synthase-like dioxygenase